MAVSYPSGAIRAFPGRPTECTCRSSTGTRESVGVDHRHRGSVRPPNGVSGGRRGRPRRACHYTMERFGNDLSFAVEGERVQWDGTTEFDGGGGTQDDPHKPTGEFRSGALKPEGFSSLPESFSDRRKS